MTGHPARRRLRRPEMPTPPPDRWQLHASMLLSPKHSPLLCLLGSRLRRAAWPIHGHGGASTAARSLRNGVWGHTTQRAAGLFSLGSRRYVDWNRDAAGKRQQPVTLSLPSALVMHAVNWRRSPRTDGSHQALARIALGPKWTVVALDVCAEQPHLSCRNPTTG
jgi:hypothetical protein